MPEDTSQSTSAPEGHAHAETSASPAEDEPINDLAQAGYEPEGVSAGHLLSLIGVTLISVAAVVLSIYFVFYAPFKDHRQQVAEDVNPNVEQVELRSQSVEALGTYGLTADSSYRIPVAEAMKKLVVRDSATVGSGQVVTRQSFNTASIELSPAPAVASVGSEEGVQDGFSRETPAQVEDPVEGGEPTESENEQ